MANMKGDAGRVEGLDGVRGLARAHDVLDALALPQLEPAREVLAAGRARDDKLHPEALHDVEVERPLAVGSRRARRRRL